MFTPRRCRVEGCTAGPCMAGNPHHCVICNNNDSTHSSKHCPLKINKYQPQTIRKCRVIGCVAGPCMAGAPHHCKNCNNYDSTHSSKNCPLLNKQNNNVQNIIKQNMVTTLGSAVIGSPINAPNNYYPKKNYYQNNPRFNGNNFHQNKHFNGNIRVDNSLKYDGTPRNNGSPRYYCNKRNDNQGNGPVNIMSNGYIYDSSGNLVARLNL
jgi:hypothetical protein